MTRQRVSRIVVWWALLATSILPALADSRIMVSAVINGHNGQLAFDTGAGVGFWILRDRLEAFELEIDPPPAEAAATPTAPGEVPLILTHPTTIDLLGQTIERRFAVLDVLPGFRSDFDGLIGWPAVSGNNWLLVMAEQRIAPVAERPPEVDGWRRFRLCREYDTLVFELPAEDEGDEPVLLTIDTGNQAGVALPPARWQTWRTPHRSRPTAITAYTIPGSGFIVGEEAWADTLPLPGLTLMDVPVNEGTITERTLRGEDVGAISMGIAALRRVDVFVDVDHEAVYVRERRDPPQPYPHNRLGAVFVPVDEASDELVARVLPSGPAYRAAIREGDVLLKINEWDATGWRANPRIHFSTIFQQPAGTRLRLTLRRGSQTITKSVVLQDMIGPASRLKKATPPT